MTAVSAIAPTTLPTPPSVADDHAAGQPAALAATVPTGEAPVPGAGVQVHPAVQQYTKKAHGAAHVQPVTKAAPKTPPPKVYDVEKTTQAEIDALKKSKDPKQQRLGWTIENAKVAYGDLFTPNAKGQKAHVTVTTSAGNGGQPVLVLTGAGFDKNAPARVHTHYHGDNATVADPLGSKAGTNARMRDSIARDPQTVFVLPEANLSTQDTDSATHDKYKPVSWGGITSQVQTTQDGLAAAGITHIGKQIVSVHSRGGSAISVLMNLDASGKLLKCDRLEMYDSLYGSQGDVAKWGSTANGKAVTDVIVYRGNLAASREAPIAQAFGKKLQVIAMKDQPKLDDPKNASYRDTVNPVFKDGNGKTHQHNRDYTDKLGKVHVNRPTVRQFDEDPHYRTTGQFLDTKPGP